MAFMIPSTLASLPDTTAGERKLFDLFRQTLPDTCVVRYEVLLGEREWRPDYMLIDPHRGVLIVEVKDWEIQKIVSATQERFRVFGFGGSPAPIPLMNPDRKCHIYLRHAREQLASMPVLRDASDRLQIPIDYFVAFPNISRHGFMDKGLDQVLSSDHVLFDEDLVTSGMPFMQRYDCLLPCRAVLTSERVKAITAALFPDIVIPHVVKPGFVSKGEHAIESGSRVMDTYNLSLEQEQIAKSLGEGPRLLHGVAGTGKTLILLYRAKMLAANDEQVRILVLCWNISLANYMRQVYDKIQFKASARVTIKHFGAFAVGLLKQHGKWNYDNDDPDVSIWEDPEFGRQLESLPIEEYEKWDAIYVDEAQDFRREWIAFLYHRLLKKAGERNLIVAADDAQRVFPHANFCYSEDLSIPFKEYSDLKTVYRNSARVWIFSAFLLGEQAGHVREGSEMVHFSSKGGYDPQLIECKSLDTQIHKAVEIVRAMLGKGYAARNVLMLYRHKNVEGFPLVKRLMMYLDQQHIVYDWIAEDTEAKRSFDWNADTVKISSIQSAKGLDSPVAIILGAETFRPELAGGEYDETRLMYVALTRAREFLAVLYTGNGGLVPKLRHCQEQYLQCRDIIISLEESGVS